jgi:hypothetical protein
VTARHGRRGALVRAFPFSACAPALVHFTRCLRARAPHRRCQRCLQIADLMTDLLCSLCASSFHHRLMHVNRWNLFATLWQTRLRHPHEISAQSCLRRDPSLVAVAPNSHNSDSAFVLHAFHRQICQLHTGPRLRRMLPLKTYSLRLTPLYRIAQSPAQFSELFRGVRTFANSTVPLGPTRDVITPFKYPKAMTGKWDNPVRHVYILFCSLSLTFV